MSFIIRLENLRFYSRIGVFEQERRVGNEFVVDVTLRVDSAGFVSEKLETTVSYADVYEIVQETMNREWELLESVASHLSHEISAGFALVSKCEVKITKLAPPFPGIQGRCSVQFTPD